MITWPFAPLRMFGYDVIVIDPPTRFELRSAKGAGKSAASHYRLMSWEDLAALPVGQLARANGVLLQWCCAPTLPQSLKLMERWGAAYRTDLVW